MVYPYPGTESFNAGGSPPPTGSQDSAVRSDKSSSKPTSTPNAPTDQELAAQARNQAVHGNIAGARLTAASIKNDQIKAQTNASIDATVKEKGGVSPPATLTSDGSGGLNDPLALFFMMIFYLKEATPTFKWDDVLKTAAKFSNQVFEAIQPADGQLPQRNFEDSGNAKAGTGYRGALTAQQNATQEALNKEQADKNKKLQAQRDADTQKMNATIGQPSSGKGGNAGPVVVWPIQCMPIINSGFSKTVDWPSNQIATLAEPTIALNKGASGIELDIEFTYAVGVYGVGDGEITAMTGQIDPVTGQPSQDSQLPGPPDPNTKSWTIEEVMGMMYLATSLVYPFKSSPVVSAPSDVKTPPASDTRTSAQFPVVFLRHYSLFPFLTPFVVKGVKIEPDEGQPLVITEAVNLNKAFKTHLTYPAVRQIVKITLSLVSAHYYLPIFGGKDQDNQIQQQTSGETYLKLSKSLLQNRIP
jgi:hypothetical protein